MDEKQMVSTNALKKQMDAAVVATHPKFAQKFEAQAAAAVAAGVSVGVAADAAPVEGFCTICVRVRPFLNAAIRAFGFFNPAIAGMAKTFMAVLYGTLIPLICGPTPPAA